MPDTQPKIRTSVVIELGGYAARRAIAIEPILQEVGLAGISLEDPLQTAPLNGVMALFERLAHILNDPCLGLNFAEAFRFSSGGLLEHIVRAAPTAREMLVTGTKYAHVFVTQIDVSFVEEGTLGHLRWTFPPSVTAPRAQFGTFLMAMVVHRLRPAAGQDWRPLMVEFQHRESLTPRNSRGVFGDRVKFNMPANQMIIDGPSLSRPLPTADPMLFAMLQELGDKWLAEARGTPSVTDATREEIAARLKQGKAGLEPVATALGITARSLQWRLEQEGTSFERVLNETRARLAEHLLRDTDRSLTEIAFDLGFSDSSAFSRAASRWFAMPPRAFRRQHRKGDIQRR